MTVWYRAHRSQKITDVFSGEGGLYFSARWNHEGNKVIYCSNSIALCTLEWLCHHKMSVSEFENFRYSIDVPDKLTLKLSHSDLPKNWHATPDTDVTRDFADEYLFNQKKYLALAVPSVVVPEEYNLVINPLHAEFKSAKKTICEMGKYTSPRR